MSIEALNRVWKLSGQKGSELLLMLALADCANDKSFCWPGEEYLAERIRMSERHTVRILTKLERAGELYRVKDKGRGRKSFYVVAVGLCDQELEQLLIEQFKAAPLEAKFAISEWRERAKPVEIKGDKLSETPMENVTEKDDNLSENLSEKDDKLSGYLSDADVRGLSESDDRCDIEGDRPTQKDDILTQKDDTGVRPYKEHEPSWNRHEPPLEPSVNRHDAQARPGKVTVRNFWTLSDDDEGGFVRRDVIEAYERMAGKRAGKSDRELVELMSGEFPYSSRAVVLLMEKIRRRAKKPVASFAYYRKSLEEIFKRCEKAAQGAAKLAAGASEARKREMILRAIRREIKTWEEGVG